MARLALIGLDRATRLALEAACPEAELREVGSFVDAAAGELIVVAAESAEFADWLGVGSSAAAPMLVVADDSAPCLSRLGARADSGTVRVLQTPLHIEELRSNVRTLLEQVSDESGTAARGQGLRYPLVGREAERFLSVAAATTHPLWLCGEVGTGRGAIAAALAELDGPSEMTAWMPGERIDSFLGRLAAGDSRVGNRPHLLLHDIETRSEDDLRALALALATASLPADARVVVTAADLAHATDRLPRDLCYRLAGLELTLEPLRERSGDLEVLVRLFALRALPSLSAPALDHLFSDAAFGELATHAWPGNLPELEAVVTRTLTWAAADGALDRPLETAAIRWTSFATDRVMSATTVTADVPAAFEADTSEPAADDPGRDVTEDVEQSSRAVVVPLAEAPRKAVAAVVPPAAGPSAAAPEDLVLLVTSLAHDLRNPMATIQTFAQLTAGAAAEQGEDSELARLAVEACARLERHVDSLHTFADLAAPKPEVLDFVEMLEAAVVEREDDILDRLDIDLAGPLLIGADRTHIKLAMTLLLEQIDAEHGGEPLVAIGHEGGDPSNRVVEMVIPTDPKPAAHLRRLVDADAAGLPWRLLLVGQLVALSGGRLEHEIEDAELVLKWTLGGNEIAEQVDVEVEEDDDQTSRAHRG